MEILSALPLLSTVLLKHVATPFRLLHIPTWCEWLYTLCFTIKILSTVARRKFHLHTKIYQAMYYPDVDTTCLLGERTFAKYALIIWVHVSCITMIISGWMSSTKQVCTLDIYCGCLLGVRYGGLHKVCLTNCHYHMARKYVVCDMTFWCDSPLKSGMSPHCHNQS